MKLIISKAIADGKRYGASLTIGRISFIAGMCLYTTGHFSNAAGGAYFFGPFALVYSR